MPEPSSAPQAGIESLLNETRVFPPPASVSASAAVKSLDEYRRLHARSIADPEGFWGEVAGELDWFTKWSRVLEWRAPGAAPGNAPGNAPTPGNTAGSTSAPAAASAPGFPDAKWFTGGTTNLCHNCVDRQVAAGLGEQTAIIWEGEPTDAAKGPEVRRLTYADLHRETQRVGNALKALGVKKGDIVTIYMPMVPELAVAMLACARIGAAHSVIFGGFSASAIADRVMDSGSRVILTADGGWRRGKIVPLKDNVDAACTTLAQSGNAVQHVIVLKRCGNEVAWDAKRDRWWHEAAASAAPACACEPMGSEDLLFVLYTSGSTGKPKGILHTTGGYMVFTSLTSKWVFDLRPGAKGAPTSDVFWCTADCGWVTGHSYVVYGILPNRVPTLMYEGAPDFPSQDRFWAMIARHKVTQFYTAPTAIRAFMKWGDDLPAKHDLSSLRVLGSVGEPINPEAWMWYHRAIGRERCPIVDTWWQTETGGHMITPLPGATPTKPGSCTLPFFGVDAVVCDEQGREMPPNTGGLLAVRKPWPSMLRGVLNDRARFLDTYFSRVRTPDGSPYYFSGDGARRDADGYVWVMGRVDDVINVAGHRLGTMEIESALVSYPGVAEAAVVGVHDDLKGTGIAAFVTLKEGASTGGAALLTPDEPLRAALRAHVTKEIGAIARPDSIRFTRALPKTRSGKIMRRLLRAIAEGREQVGDTTTLEDYGVLAKLRESEEG